MAQIKEHHSKIESCTEDIKAEIELLEEMKARIISDVVTGQIDVRNMEVPDFEMVEEIDESVDEDEVLEDEEQEEEA